MLSKMGCLVLWEDCNTGFMRAVMCSDEASAHHYAMNELKDVWPSPVIVKAQEVKP